MPEQSRGMYHKWQDRNFALLPAAEAKSVTDLLLQSLPPEKMSKWYDQHMRGMAIGSDDPTFHNGDVGDAETVIALCKQVINDDDLPEVYRNYAGELWENTRSWDHMFMGALARAVEYFGALES